MKETDTKVYTAYIVGDRKWHAGNSRVHLQVRATSFVDAKAQAHAWVGKNTNKVEGIEIVGVKLGY